MIRTSNLRVRGLTPIIAPTDLKQVFPLSERGATFVTQAREQICAILHHRDARLMAVVGPCSIHDPKAALDYASRLARLALDIEDQVLLVMRVYFEKPRTTVGWKGLINDPELTGTHQISKGSVSPAACSAHYRPRPADCRRDARPDHPSLPGRSDQLGAIGARTTESRPIAKWPAACPSRSVSRTVPTATCKSLSMP